MSSTSMKQAGTSASIPPPTASIRDAAISDEERKAVLNRHGRAGGSTPMNLQGMKKMLYKVVELRSALLSNAKTLDTVGESINLENELNFNLPNSKSSVTKANIGQLVEMILNIQEPFVKIHAHLKSQMRAEESSKLSVCRSTSSLCQNPPGAELLDQFI